MKRVTPIKFAFFCSSVPLVTVNPAFGTRPGQEELTGQIRHCKMLLAERFVKRPDWTYCGLPILSLCKNGQLPEANGLAFHL
ncbi:hypothetical protein BDV33DRAFT_185788 [Aspergillus novoparasiticus]|uniref:Uncharacterized protein n=1 Tax=Aspergillus novoparasiticus TaxID=986946 RepID=A0A5N6E6N1_9EURO|nr:hypothetical protein BDV33DRAFT_185788 [Aspergillus novoparasiticus]